MHLHPTAGAVPESEPRAVLGLLATATPKAIACSSAALLAMGIVAREGLSIVNAVLSPSARTSTDLFASGLREHERAFSLAEARWAGAALFGVQPPVPPRDSTPIATAVQAPSRPAPAPAEYQGPRLTALFGPLAIFQGKALRVGESGSGVTLLALPQPGELTGVRVRYQPPGYEAGEYVLSLWPGTPLGLIEHEPQNRR